MHSTVTVLLATHNGESYIQQMVDSVLTQDHSDIRIVLSDDSSSDNTEQILAQYAQDHPDIITHYRSGMRFGCAQKHFMHLLSVYQDSPYIMFCDQDDVWHKDKVRKTIQHMKQIEGNNPALPVLVHTDLRVVDKDLYLISPSFCTHSGLDGKRLSLNQLLVQNVVTGCTVMVNSALAQLACSAEYSDSMLMHDWWLALLASCCGKASFLDEATIDYRQHGNNSVGAKNVRSLSYLLHRLRSSSMRESLKDAANQAEAFLSAYQDVLVPEQQQLIRAFIATKDQNLLQRNLTYLRSGLLKNGTVRKIAQLLGL